MAYDSRRISEAVVKRLRQSPSLTLESLAQELHIHRHTLCRALKTEYDTTFSAMKRAQFVALSSERLRSAEAAQIKEVAIAMGFRSQQAFSSRFRKLMKATPTAFRRS